MLLYVIALLPIIVYVLVVKAMDGFSLASWRRLIPGFIWGAFCCGTIFLAARITEYDNSVLSTFLEEFLQLVLVILLMTGLLIVINDIDEKLIHKWHITAGFNKRGAPERHFSRRIPHGDASQVPAGRLF